MSNRLLNPYNFVDGNGNQPPTCWNGTAYVLYQSTDLGLLIAPNDGDSLTFSISSTEGNSSFHASCIGPYGEILQLVNGTTSNQPATYNVALPVGSTSYVLSIAVGPGDIVTMTPSAEPAPTGPDPGQGPAPAPAPATGPNILLNAAGWQDKSGAAPPSYWNGTAYEFLSSYGDAQSITTTASAAGIVAFTLKVNAISTRGTSLALTINGTTVYTNDLQALGDFTFASGPLSAGDVAVLNFSDGSGYGVYDLDASLTPTPNVLPPPPPPAPVIGCTELGRVTRCFVSGYQRDRIHESRLVRGEFRCLVANFNGAIDLARFIVSVTWRCEQPYSVAMANARIADDTREVAVDITAQMMGGSWIKCLATLDNGEVYTQMFRLSVADAPWFDDATPSAGPMSLTSP